MEQTKIWFWALVVIAVITTASSTSILSDYIVYEDDLNNDNTEEQVIKELDERSGETFHPRDCAELFESGKDSSGVYTIYIAGDRERPLAVYCDMTTDGGGWTVIQRRADGSEQFYRGWSDYACGFGRPSKEHWLGNNNIHAISADKKYSLRIDMEDFNHHTRFAHYSNFKIGAAADKYKLISVGTFSGNAGDSLSGPVGSVKQLHVGQMFSTYDNDNDKWTAGNCAATYRGAWWYNECHVSNLNGAYLRGSHSSFADGIEWYTWLGYYYSLKTTEMKIRPEAFKN